VTDGMEEKEKIEGKEEERGDREMKDPFGRVKEGKGEDS
jgi:hypothetical protein